MARRGISRRFLFLLALGIFGSNVVQATPPPQGGGDDLRLAGNRFQVVSTWKTAGGLSGAGHAISLTGDTGAFWFFAPSNLELVVKVLDACAPPFGRFWVFAAGLTDVEVTVTVTDFSTGKVQTYTNAQGQAFLPVQDADAFAGCPDSTPHACGQGTAAEVAATPRADADAERLALVLGGGVTAWPWVYERVHEDLGSIRAQQPEVASVGFLPQIGTSSLTLWFQLDTDAQIQAGTYHAWDCLNQWYGASVKRASSGAVRLTLPGRYNMRRLLPEYAALPGLAIVDFDRPDFGDSFCATVNGATFNYYVLLNASSTLYYFTSRPGSAPVRQGAYFPATDGPTPAWVQDALSCFATEVVGCCVLS
jgi:hypothetical protein